MWLKFFRKIVAKAIQYVSWSKLSRVTPNVRFYMLGLYVVDLVQVENYLWILYAEQLLHVNEFDTVGKYEQMTSFPNVTRFQLGLKPKI